MRTLEVKDLPDALGVLKVWGIRYQTINRIQNSLVETGTVFFNRGVRVAFHNESFNELHIRS